jgi:aconitate hydratase
MAFDIEMIKKVYAEMPAKVEAARKMLGRPLTLSEKILNFSTNPIYSL